MLNKIDSNSPEDWSDRVKGSRDRPSAPPRSDDYRRLERDKRRSPTKDESGSSSVEEGKKESVFDISKKKTADKKPAPQAKEKKLAGAAEKEDETSFAPSGKTSPKQDVTEETAFEGDQEPLIQEESPKKSDSMENELLESESLENESLDTVSTSEQEPAPASKGSPETSADPSKVKQQTDQTAVQRPKTDGLPSSKEEKLPGTEVKGEKRLDKKEKSKEEGRTSSLEKGGEKAGAVAFNAPIQGSQFKAESAQAAQGPSRSSTIQELASQIVERIQVMRKEDQTTTTITLKQPPELAGSTITLTSSDHAKREFNISFANLSPDGKFLLEQKLKEDPLTDTLGRKGIIVHQLTTSTEPEKLISAQAGQPESEQQRNQSDQQEQQRKQQSFEEIEEEKKSP